MTVSRSHLGFRQPLSLIRFLFEQRVRGFPPPGRLGLDDQAAKRFLDELKLCKHYLEFGSGGSTLVADRLRIPTVSVESDRFYGRTVKRMLRPDTSVTMLDIYLGITREWSQPIFRQPVAARLDRWRCYTAMPLLHLSQQGVIPDFVLVDGRFRRSCILEVARTAITAGRAVRVMVDDYYDAGREHYRQVEGVLGNPEKIGRAALFQIDREAPVRMPTQTELQEASVDYR